MSRMIVPLVFGVAGAAVLVSLGFWQLQRLAWKESVLAQIDARISQPPVSLPAAPLPDVDRYLPVSVSGRTVGEDIKVLVSVKPAGPGYRIISAFETDDGRRILLDEGFVPAPRGEEPRPALAMDVRGNLHWPDEIDMFTPDPDPDKALAFARDVDYLSAVLKTEPVLLVARDVSVASPRATPLPVTSQGIPNNHLGYAIQWFGLAIVWVGMTAYFLWRGRASEQGNER